jgi:hypothetical protein
MTPFAKWTRNLFERLSGKFYEGPECPERIAKMVIDFANVHPTATRGDWVAFATRLAAEAYTSGYVRGFERSERDDAAKTWLSTSPEAMADRLDPDWRWSPDITLHGPADMIPDVDAPSPEELAMQTLRELNEG